MKPPPAGLLDTSIFIARETGRPLEPLPAQVAVSVMTIGELQLGVLAADNDDARHQRIRTLALARTADPIVVDEAVVAQWAQLVMDCRHAGITRTVRLVDALIAATAMAHDIPVVTQDAGYEALAEATAGLEVWRV